MNHARWLTTANRVLRLYMLFDKKELVRQKAITMIENLIDDPLNEQRKFVVPQINFTATTYFSMINFSELEITAPLLIADFNKESLKELYKSDIGKTISKIPCHSQAVERHVKIVTESASSVTDLNRHGFILNKLSLRTKII